MAAMLRLVGVMDVTDELEGIDDEEEEQRQADPEPAALAILSEEEFRGVIARVATSERLPQAA
jgi:hypothetical protein